ncbi:MAG: polysulfide reductase NrfD [Candidatus Rokubacteria bacterium]|nr:polysulfide reductase NrfD [Candidatus Rokubacteria bacterium]
MKSDVEALAIEYPNLLPLVRAPKGYQLLLGLTLLVIAWGVYVYTLQWRVGLAVTGMSNPATWALYIVNFVFFIGASAGGIIVGAIAYALGIERFRPVARIAELGAISCLVLATIFIMLDLGRPERFWHLLRYPQFESPLIWDVMIIGIYLAIAMALGYFATRPDLVRCMEALPRRRGLYRLLALGYTDLSPSALARERRVLKVLAAVSIPAAVLLHSITAWILGLVKAQPGWHSALIAPLFIVSAVVSGLALVILAAVFSRLFLGLKIGEEVIWSLGRILFFSIPVLGYFLFAEMLTVVYPRVPAGVHVFSQMMFGPYAGLFWFDLVGGLIVPFLLLAFPRTRTVGGIGFASFLVVLGVLAERWNIVIPPLLGHTNLPYPPGGYTPTWPELSLTVAAYAVGLLVYLVLAKLLPLVELEEGRG